jgi:hypothetical protein
MLIITVTNINLFNNTLTGPLTDVSITVPGHPECSRTPAQTAVLFSAITPNFDPGETFSYICTTTSGTNDGTLTVTLTGTTLLGTVITTTDTTTIISAGRALTKCSDSNSDGIYDACSSSGNGPLCTSPSECSKLPTVSHKD